MGSPPSWRSHGPLAYRKPAKRRRLALPVVPRHQAREARGDPREEGVPRASLQRLTADQALDEEADVGRRQGARARLRVDAPEPLADRRQETILQDDVEHRGGGR